MRISIKNRLMVSFAAVITLVLVFQLVFNLFFAKSYYRAYQENMIYQAYAQLEQQYDGTAKSIEDAVEVYESSNNLDVMVWVEEQLSYASFGRLMPDSMAEQSVGKNNGLTAPHTSYVQGKIEQVPRELLLGDRGQGGHESQGNVQGAVGAVPQIANAAGREPLNNAEVLRLVNEFDYHDERVVVVISLSFDSIERSAEVFSNSSLLISAVALLIGIVYSLFLSKSITKPISEIQQIAEEFASLDFSREANELVSSKELYQLACSINSMSRQLEKNIAALQTANETLRGDIDAQKKMEQMRREFVGNVSHEMKTPLTMLQIYAESLKDNIESVDKDYYCNTIMEETKTLNDLVGSMLDISSIESGLSNMHMEKFDLSSLLVALLERMQPLTIPYCVVQEITPRLMVVGDAKYLEQAMKNYVTNAIEHTSAGGAIKIVLRPEKQGVLYCVENSGQQLTEEDMPKLWDSFYRADKARSHANKNVGLGLHIVKTVIEKHFGKYMCENVTDGVAFSFWVPCGNIRK